MVNGRSVREVSAAAIAVALIFSATGQYAFSDNLINTIGVSVGTVTITAGDSFGATYYVRATGTGGMPGCDATGTSPAQVTVHVPASATGLTATPSTFNISSCDTPSSSTLEGGVPVTFTSLQTTPGSTGSGYPITVSVTDSLGAYDLTDSDFFVKVIALDTTAPVITPEVSGTLGNDNWYVSDVTVSWTVTDSQSSITSTAGCEPTTVSTDTSGMTLTCSATSAGGTSSNSVTIKRDATAPIIGASATPTPNAAGWNNVDVTISFTCSDAMSGISSCPVDSVIGEGENQEVTGTATDNAGNTASVSVSGIDVDKTAPSVAATASPDPNSDGWNNGNVVVSFDCEDMLSGIDSCPTDITLSEETAIAGTEVSGTAIDNAGNSMTVSLTVKIDKAAPIISATLVPSPNPNAWHNSDVLVDFGCSDVLSGLESCSDDLTLTTEGVGQSVSGTAVDNAGNSASITVNGINIDKTNPSIVGSRSPAANGFGWNNGDVTVHFDCSDLLSGIDSCSADILVTSEGENQSFTGSATDLAGNTDSATVSEISIDKTAPEITGSASPAANVHGWSNTDVTVSFMCSDSLSGIQSCTDPITLAAEGAGQSATGTATDKADNSASATVSGINIDKTAPSVSLVLGPADGESYYFGSVPAEPSCTASDGLSGIDGACAISGYGTTVGIHTVTATVSDNAGNTNSASHTYTVLAWTINGFYQPVDMNGVYNLVKAGSTVPLKFEVFAGTELVDVAVRDTVKQTKITCESAATVDELEQYTTTGQTVFRYDTTTGQFIDNWKSPTTKGACYKVTMTFDDGSTLAALFKTK